MALFKICRGPSANLDNMPYKDGYCYFTIDEQKFYIDHDDTRSALNAYASKRLLGRVIENELSESTVNIPTVWAVYDALQKYVVGEIEVDITFKELLENIEEQEANINTLIDEDYKPRVVIQEPVKEYLTFSSPEEFTISVESPGWDSIIEYSTDLITWTEWNGGAIGGTAIYMRGKGNSVITGGSDATHKWTLEGSNISCNGNIETLLDYATVRLGEHPTMKIGCYRSMFSNCTSLAVAPELPATTLTSECYYSMFSNCSALIITPVLSANILPSHCYYFMFKNCTALTTISNLSATSLTTSSCRGMFSGCTSLVTIPMLPITSLSKTCYSQMFQNCTSLKLSAEKTDEYTIPYRIPTEGEGTENNSLTNMFSNTGGTFTGTPEINTTYYLHKDCSIVSSSEDPLIPTDSPNFGNHIADLDNPHQVTLAQLDLDKVENKKDEDLGISNALQAELDKKFTNLDGEIGSVMTKTATQYEWQKSEGSTQIKLVKKELDDYMIDITSCLTFSSPETFSLSVAYPNWDGTMYYSLGDSWNEWDGSEISGTTIYVRGSGNSIVTGKNNNFQIGDYDLYHWALNGSNISCNGNIETLLDYKTVKIGSHPPMSDACYMYLFMGCEGLISSPSLPALSLTKECYSYLFYGCINLTIAPELPATILADSCYSQMFLNCIKLDTAPALPATTLARNCYGTMFAGCALSIPPILPATILTDYCYSLMFQGCVNLTIIPKLPATILANNCYWKMFQNCQSLKLSTTETDEYTIPYAIPSEGEGTIADNALTDMFSNTGGTFTGTPEINTTYYLHKDCQTVPETEVGGSEIPSDATELEYLRSTGTQYIDTGVDYGPSNYNTLRIVADTVFTNSNDTFSVHGCGNGSTAACHIGATRGKLICGDGITVYNTEQNYTYGTRVTFDVDMSQGLYSVTDCTDTHFTVQEATSALNMYLFGYDGGTAQPVSAILYSCQIYDNDTLIRDFVPVKDSSGVACLYDKVGKQYYYNAGSGVFNKEISFTVSSNGEEETFTAEEGMTWKEFVNSEYNINNLFAINNSNLMTYKGIYMTFLSDGYSLSLESEKIIENGEKYYANACCFVAGTQVLTSLEGETKSIEIIQPGDTVVSYNIETGENYLTLVQKLILRPNSIDMARVKLENGTELNMRRYHPIYTINGFHSLTDPNYNKLVVGDVVKTLDGWNEIIEIEEYDLEEPIITYNLAVKDFDESIDNDINDNYYANSIVVHNAPC